MERLKLLLAQWEEQRRVLETGERFAQQFFLELERKECERKMREFEEKVLSMGPGEMLLWLDWMERERDGREGRGAWWREWFQRKWAGELDKQLKLPPGLDQWEHQKLILDRTFNAILRLSSWRPSAANNDKLIKLVGNAKEQLDWLRDDDDHQTYLREFMTKHRILCAFIVSRAEDIALQESMSIAELCQELRTLTHKLRRNAVKKAEEFERLYEEFTANREGLSDWLNSASTGRALFDTFTGSLKGVANSMRREADFWEYEGNKIEDWQDTLQHYSCALDSITPVHADASHTSNLMPTNSPPLGLVENAQRVSTSFSVLQTSVPGAQPKIVQMFLAKTHQSIVKRFNSTRAYLALVSGVAKEQFSQHRQGKLSQPMLQDIKTTALQVAKAWSKLHSWAECGKPIFTLFSKPLRVLPAFDVSESHWDLFSSDPHNRITTSFEIASKRLHPFLIHLEVLLYSTHEHFSSCVRVCDAIHSLLVSIPMGHMESR